MPRSELKHVWYHDNEVQLNTLTQGAMQAYPLIAQGVTENTRVGNDISLKSFQIKGILNNNSGGESYARVVIVGHPGTLDPTMSTFPIFQLTQAGNYGTVSQVNGLDTMYFPINKNELTIYHDRVFKLGAGVAGNSASNTRMFSKMIKFPGQGKKISYKANNFGTGQQNWMISVVWIVADANDDTTTGTVVELSQMTRYWFTDS